MAENTKKEKNNLQPLFEEVGRIPPQAIDFEEVVLGAGKIIGIADGLEHVVLPTCAMKIMNNLIVIKQDVK